MACSSRGSSDTGWSSRPPCASWCSPSSGARATRSSRSTWRSTRRPCGRASSPRCTSSAHPPRNSPRPHSPRGWWRTRCATSARWPPNAGSSGRASGARSGCWPAPSPPQCSCSPSGLRACATWRACSSRPGRWRSRPRRPRRRSRSSRAMPQCRAGARSMCAPPSRTSPPTAPRWSSAPTARPNGCGSRWDARRPTAPSPAVSST